METGKGVAQGVRFAAVAGALGILGRHPDRASVPTPSRFEPRTVAPQVPEYRPLSEMQKGALIRTVLAWLMQ